MGKKDLELIHLGVGFFVAPAVLLEQWGNALAGADGLVAALDVIWWLDRRGRRPRWRLTTFPYKNS